MTGTKWKELKHFKPRENWGDPTLMNRKLLKTLDEFREYIKTPIFISQGTQGTHSVDSWHYKGKAVDIVFPGTKLRELPDILLNALRFPFNGLGFYPHWNYHGDIIGGLHLDVRPVEFKALWMAYLSPDPYKPGNQKQVYSPLTFKSLHAAVTF